MGKNVHIDARVTLWTASHVENMSQKKIKKLWARIQNVLCKIDMQNEHQRVPVHMMMVPVGGGPPEPVYIYIITRVFARELMEEVTSIEP